MLVCFSENSLILNSFNKYSTTISRPDKNGEKTKRRSAKIEMKDSQDEAMNNSQK